MVLVFAGSKEHGESSIWKKSDVDEGERLGIDFF